MPQNGVAATNNPHDPVHSRWANNLVDLEEDILKPLAIKAYKSRHRPFKLKFRSLFRKTYIEAEVNWSQTEVVADPVNFEAPPVGAAPKSVGRTLFENDFKNKTDSDQDFNFATERVTVSSTEVTIHEGYSKCGSINLRIGTESTGIGGEIGHSINIENSSTKTTEKEVRWTVDNALRVKGNNHLLAKLQVTEIDDKTTFTQETRISGPIGVRVVERLSKDADPAKYSNKSWTYFTTPIEEYKALPKDQQKPTDNFSIDKEARTLVIKTRGVCQLHYAVNQHVEANEHVMGSYDCCKQ